MTPVRGALRPGSGLLRHVADGLGGVRAGHVREYFDASVRALFADSLDIDANLMAGHERENRWDYLLGHQISGKVIGLEPHSANTDQVSKIIRKRTAALDQLRPHLRPGAHVAEWLWVASGKVDFADTEKARFRLDQAGIKFVGRRVLMKHLPRNA